MVELSEYVPINLICAAALAALGLRRLVRMDGHHWPRVVILTGFLWALAIYLFVIAYLPSYPGCMPDSEESGTFRIYSASLSGPGPR